MKQWIKLTLTLALGVFLPSAAWAAGFALNDYGARGAALGGPMPGEQTDPSALAVNPAGLAGLTRWQSQAGLILYKAPDAVVKTQNPYSGAWDTSHPLSSDWYPIPQLFLAGPLTPNLTMGLGAYPRFGLAAKYDQDWPGRYNVYEAAISTMSVKPVLAYKVNEVVSLAAGLEMMKADYQFNLKIDPLGQNNSAVSAYDIDTKHTMDGWGWGGNLGLQVKPCDELALSLNYQSQVKLNLSGDVRYIVPQTLQGMLPASYFRNGSAEMDVTLPAQTWLAASFKAAPRLTLVAGVAWTQWSSIDRLVMEYGTAPVPGLDSSAVNRYYRDTWRYNVGAEYNLLPWLDLRASYVLDQCPVDAKYGEYSIPSGDYLQWLNLGAGFKFGQESRIKLDVSYSYMVSDSLGLSARPQDGVLAGEVTDLAGHVVGLSVTYLF